jgi:signal transduction histidine kinase
MKRKMRLSLATKYAMTFAPLFLMVMLLTIYAVHRTVTIQHMDRYERDLHAARNAIESELKARKEAVTLQLQQLAYKIQDDYDFRLYTGVIEQVHHPYIVDYAQRHMATMGLQALEIISGDGVVLSSGHYRSAFGGNAAGLLRNMQAVGDTVVLVPFETADGYVLCLAAAATARVGNSVVHVVGGRIVTEAFLKGLQPNPRNILFLSTPVRIISSTPEEIDPELFRDIEGSDLYARFSDRVDADYSFIRMFIPIVGRSLSTKGEFYLLHSRSELNALIDTLNEKLLAIAVVGIIFVLILAFWQAGNIARPLRRLAYRASHVSLDRLDTDFNIRSSDEVGVLNDTLRAMMQRLRQNRIDIAHAEQKAAFADIARKVNHDIKNGFLPIRNVMHHWTEVAEEDPANLVKIFNERKETIDESISYLEQLAKNYAQSKPILEQQRIPVREMIDTIIKNYHELPDKDIRFEVQSDTDDFFVYAEPTQLRRALENIFTNALEACDKKGSIIIKIQRQERQVQLTIQDTGTGIPEDVLSDLFHRHVTTKPDGTGLGLMNTYAIIKEMKGMIRIESKAGAGTTVYITLPGANTNEPTKERL